MIPLRERREEIALDLMKLLITQAGYSELSPAETADQAVKYVDRLISILSGQLKLVPKKRVASEPAIFTADGCIKMVFERVFTDTNMHPGSREVSAIETAIREYFAGSKPPEGTQPPAQR